MNSIWPTAFHKFLTFNNTKKPGTSLTYAHLHLHIFEDLWPCVNELVNCILGRIDIRLETRECRCLLFSLSKICVQGESNCWDGYPRDFFTNISMYHANNIFMDILLNYFFICGFKRSKNMILQSSWRSAIILDILEIWSHKLLEADSVVCWLVDCPKYSKRIRDNSAISIFYTMIRDLTCQLDLDYVTDINIKSCYMCIKIKYINY